jgi:hypothetical protein
MPSLRQRDPEPDTSSDEEEFYGRYKQDYNNKAKTVPPTRTGHRNVQPSKVNLDKYSKYFPGTGVNAIKKTLEATMQYGSSGEKDGFNLKNQIESPNPILNIPRRHEPVATDTMYSKTPAVDDGSTAAQFFIGRISHYRSARPLGKSDKQYVHVLMDEIRKYGAMDLLISDNAKAQISAKVKDIL